MSPKRPLDLALLLLILVAVGCSSSTSIRPGNIGTYVLETVDGKPLPQLSRDSVNYVVADTIVFDNSQTVSRTVVLKRDDVLTPVELHGPYEIQGNRVILHLWGYCPPDALCLVAEMPDTGTISRGAMDIPTRAYWPAKTRLHFTRR